MAVTIGPIAQRQQLPDSITFTDSAGQALIISRLRIDIDVGKKIYASDLNKITDMINNMNGHYHTYTDAYQLATYGAPYGNSSPSAGDRTNYTRAVNSSAPNSITTVTGVTAGQSITASKHNDLSAAINKLRSHNHTVSDQSTK